MSYITPKSMPISHAALITTLSLGPEDDGYMQDPRVPEDFIDEMIFICEASCDASPGLTNNEMVLRESQSY